MHSPAPTDRQIAEALASSKIFFGHQSVGGNVLEGVAALQLEQRELAGIRLVALAAGQPVENPGVYHSRIGKNRDIPSKLAAFEDMLVRQGYGQKLDVALMKLCYVDIEAETNVGEVFEAYRSMIDRIRKQCPALRLVHCTVPLTLHTTGLKSMVKNWLKGDRHNANRSKFNESIRRYAPEIFDIAEVEATRPDGSVEVFSYQGARCHSAAPCYMDGTGHLNPVGAKRAGRVFLETLARVAQTAAPQGKKAA